jgi:geranylgeranyl reductase family protein
MTEESWDLVVVGAGPAGASAALGALREQPSLRVLLLDRDDFPRDKCCGDGIAPHVFDALRDVGVEDVQAGWAPIPSLEMACRGSVVRRRMSRPARVIPRSEFDARLVTAAVSAGAVLRRHRTRTVERVDDRVLVDRTFSAAVVVGADGAHSVVRRSTGLRDPRRQALAIRGYAPTPEARSGSQVIRHGDRRQPAYAWAFDRGDGWSNVGYGELLPTPGSGVAAPSRALLLAELERLLPGAAQGGRSWRGHHLPLTGWRIRPARGPVALVGDAAALVNPLSGEGIFYAVTTGIEAGRAAARALRAGAPGSTGGRYAAALRPLLGSHLRHTWAASRLASFPTVVESGVRAAARDQHSFDALVELGLGDGRITPRLARHLASSIAVPARHQPRPPTEGAPCPS